MNVEVRSSSGVTVVPLESMLLSARKVYLKGEITIDNACDIAKQLTYLCSKSHDRIELIICSPGGDIHAGLMLYDYIQSCPAPILTICSGYAYSMAAVIFCSGIYGRYMLPNSELMLHEPMLGAKIGGNASSVLSASEGLLRIKKKICAILAKHTDKSIDEIEQAICYDHFYSAEEAINFGLADRIIGMWDLEGSQ